MQIQVEKVYGSCKIKLMIEAADQKEAMFKASIFTQKDRCILCKQESIGLEGNRDREGNIYIKRRCQSCTATSSLGTYKTGGYFWHNWEKYQPQKSTQSAESVPPIPEDLPFQ